jgi:hypothetical protein
MKIFHKIKNRKFNLINMSNIVLIVHDGFINVNIFVGNFVIENFYLKIKNRFFIDKIVCFDLKVQI